MIYITHFVIVNPVVSMKSRSVSQEKKNFEIRPSFWLIVGIRMLPYIMIIAS